MAKTRFLELAQRLDVDSQLAEAWFDATSALGEREELVAHAYRWSTNPPDKAARHLTRPILEYLEGTRPPSLWQVDALLLDRALSGVVAGTTDIFSSTEAATAALFALFDQRPDGPGGPIRERIPEWRALTEGTPVFAANEHEAFARFPLLENLVERTLGRSFRALETGNQALFPSGPSLSAQTFGAHGNRLERLRSAGLAPVVRAALAFLDFTKGGSEPMRRSWVDSGADLSMHNVASRRVLEASQRLEKFDSLAGPGHRELVLALVECHGVTGQVVRGECTWLALEPVANALRKAARELDVDDPSACVVHALHVVNVCDTSAVRHGLWTDDLADRFDEVESVIRRLVDTPASDLFAQELGEHESGAAWLSNRILKLRQRRLNAGEPANETHRAVAGLQTSTLDRVVQQLGRAQVWYGEAATADLSPESQLKLLVLASNSVPNQGPHHINLAPLMSYLNDGSRTSDYRVRLLDTVLSSVSMEAILQGQKAIGPLVALQTEIGGEFAGVISLEESPEATALLTLLPIYETKNSAAFHRTLKEMCDLYGLRKDEFDRVANEALYLEHMNSARTDKQRMVDWCTPGLIVEVGPGGGVVLDLLEARFPDSRVVGLDISQMVCEALRSRKQAEGRSWEVLEGDAYDLPNHVDGAGASTIVYCSVLHEIYSYVPYPRGGSEAEQFRMESVRDLIRASWDALAPGGRLVIRDGIRPPDGRRRIRFKDPHGPEFLRLFAAQFEGRQIVVEWLDDTTAELSAADAMEFLYCYTWGPASFPYEVREQYGIMEYDEYVRSIVTWVAELEGEPVVVDIPRDERSYLQPGYIDGLAPKVDLLDEHDQPVSLPDSNCLIVIEKSV